VTYAVRAASRSCAGFIGCRRFQAQKCGDRRATLGAWAAGPRYFERVIGHYGAVPPSPYFLARPRRSRSRGAIRPRAFRSAPTEGVRESRSAFHRPDTAGPRVNRNDRTNRDRVSICVSRCRLHDFGTATQPAGICSSRPRHVNRLSRVRADRVLNPRQRVAPLRLDFRRV